MAEQSSSATTAGILTGILFTAVAMIPNSHAYPLIVPLLGGALAVYLAGRASSVGIGDGAKLGAKAGAIGGLIFVLIGTPLIYLLVGPAMREQLRGAGLNLPLDGLLALLAGLLIVAVIGLLLAIIGGVVTALVIGRR
jgi:hypothetical protein